MYSNNVEKCKKNGLEVELVEMENEKYFCFVSTVQERK